MVSFEKISEKTCFELAYDYVQKNEKIQYINDFLIQHYPLDGFKIQLIQANVEEESVSYRFLYSSKTLKQI